MESSRKTELSDFLGNHDNRIITARRKHAAFNVRHISKSQPTN